MSELAPLDPELVADVLSKHPFVTIDGVYNVRDLGRLPVADGQRVTKSSFMIRGGEISGVTHLGALSFTYLRVSLTVSLLGEKQLRALGITTIFDLRSDTEITKYDTETPKIAGITVLRAPVFATKDYSPERMAQ